MRVSERTFVILVSMKRIKSIIAKVKNDNEKAARKAVLEDIFYDMYTRRYSIYKLNFFRGVFLGLGTVLGGTIVVALIIWILALLSDVVPPLKNFFVLISDLLESAKK